MKKYAILFCLFLAFAIDAYSQFSSLEAYGDYNFAFQKKNNVKSAKGYGGGLIAKISVFDNFKIGLKAGYKLYDIDQPGVMYPSREFRNNRYDTIYKVRWGWENWDYWNKRYAYTVVDNQAANPNLKASLGVMQKMDVVEAAISLSYDVDIDRFKIVPNLDFGYIFAVRRLYIIERWSKYFPEINYAFKYSYRTFAPKKNISTIVAGGGLTIGYAIIDNIYLNVGGNYVYADLNKNKTTLLPFSSESNFQLSLTFKY